MRERGRWGEGEREREGENETRLTSEYLNIYVYAYNIFIYINEKCVRARINYQSTRTHARMDRRYLLSISKVCHHR